MKLTKPQLEGFGFASYIWKELKSFSVCFNVFIISYFYINVKHYFHFLKKIFPQENQQLVDQISRIQIQIKKYIYLVQENVTNRKALYADPTPPSPYG